ncbi:MAG: glycosyltransferase family 4 protein [Bdellovibrionales bacterium]|nr:glycosyltransferase family 4 protein [Bdellovibrionales bacterium]
MRVYFSDHIFSSQRFGGVSRIFAEIMPKMANLKIDVGYLGCTHINDYFDPPGPTPSAHVPWMPRNLRRLGNDLVEKHFLKTRKPDIVHVTYYPTETRTARYADAKLAVTVYDMIHERMPRKVDPKDPTPVLKRLVCQKADLIFAISEHTKSDLVEIYGLPAEKIVVTHLASSLKPARPSSTGTQGTINFPTGSEVEKPFFLYVGARAGYKNFALVLQAFANLAKTDKDCVLVCFGGPPFQSTDFEDFRRLGIQDRIHLVSGNDEILSRYYRSAIALVYPSLYEGFGIPPLEAMGQGCPVIASNASSIPEVVGNAGILFDPYNLEALENAMTQVRAPAKRAALVHLGYQQEALFSWDKTTAQTIQGYRLIF